MKRVIIIYRSKTGTTKKFGEQIFSYLQANGILPEIRSIEEINDVDLSSYHYFFLGCWTSGLLFFMQRPEKLWIDFAQKLPVLARERTILFTTYKLRTGSMFNGMRKHLKFKDNSVHSYELKSRDGELQENNQILINEFLR